MEINIKAINLRKVNDNGNDKVEKEIWRIFVNFSIILLNLIINNIDEDDAFSAFFFW